MGYRNATSTTVITGATLFQTAWTDNNGVIQSFDGSSGDNEIEKYWKPSTLEVLYKKKEASAFPLAFFAGNTASYTWDGATLTTVSHSGLDQQFWGAVIFKGEFYVIDSVNNLKKSSTLATWTDTLEDGISLATDGTTLVIAYTTGGSFKYTTDGTNWNLYNSFSPGVLLNAVRYIPATNLWVAVGYWDDLIGSGNYLPWCATASTPAGPWTQYPMTGGDGWTSILDVAYSGGTYIWYCYVSTYSSYLNWYTCAPGALTYSYSDGYTTADASLSLDRYASNTPIATPNNKIVSAIGDDYWLGNGTTEHAATWACYPPAQDSNGDAYVIEYDNYSATEYFNVKNSSNSLVVALPGPAYICGGSV